MNYRLRELPLRNQLQHPMAPAAHDTRPPEQPAVPLPVLRARWRTAAVRVFGAERVDQLLALARRAAAAIRAAARPLVDLAGAAADVAAVVYVHRGRFHRRRLLAEARRHLAHGPGRVGCSTRSHRFLTPVARPLSREQAVQLFGVSDSDQSEAVRQFLHGVAHLLGQVRAQS